MPLHPEVAGFLAQFEQAGGVPIEEMTPQEARDMMSAMTFPVTDAPCKSVRDIDLDIESAPIAVRIYTPEGEEPHPILVYFHGGGWVLGDLESHDGVCRDLCGQTPCIVVSVDYRLAPEHPFPTPLLDCFMASSWVFQYADEFGGDAYRIAVGGDSAGGNLAAAVSLLRRDMELPPPVFQLLVYPATDGTRKHPSVHENAEGYFLTAKAMDWFWKHYCDAHDAYTDRFASPLIAEDLSNLPPAFVMTAEFDPLRDEGIAYAEALSDAGNRVEHKLYEGMIHGFFNQSRILPCTAQGMEDAVARLRAAFA